MRDRSIQETQREVAQRRYTMVRDYLRTQGKRGATAIEIGSACEVDETARRSLISRLAWMGSRGALARYDVLGALARMHGTPPRVIVYYAREFYPGPDDLQLCEACGVQRNVLFFSPQSSGCAERRPTCYDCETEKLRINRGTKLRTGARTERSYRPPRKPSRFCPVCCGMAHRRPRRGCLACLGQYAELEPLSTDGTIGLGCAPWSGSGDGP